MKKIRTEFVHPPIPNRNMDWTAVDEDSYDGPGSPIGYGATEQEAIEDLKEQTEAYWELRAERLMTQAQVDAHAEAAVDAAMAEAAAEERYADAMAEAAENIMQQIGEGR